MRHSKLLQSTHQGKDLYYHYYCYSVQYCKNAMWLS